MQAHVTWVLRIAKRSVLLMVLFTITTVSSLWAQYVPPASNRVDFNFNHDWKFIRSNLKGSGINPEVPGYDDSAWVSVSLPHTWNDVDKWREWVSTRNDSPGESTYYGNGWYRKHFTIHSTYSARKTLLELQGSDRQARVRVRG